MSDSCPSETDENSVGKELVMFNDPDAAGSPNGVSELGSNHTVVISDSAQSENIGDVFLSGNMYKALVDIPEEEENYSESTVPTEGEEHLFSNHHPVSLKPTSNLHSSPILTRSQLKVTDNKPQKRKMVDPNNRGRGRGRESPVG